MNMTQKTICIVRCDKTTLPILDYIDSRSLIALSLSKGVILWVYKGLAMLIPPERIANAVRMMEMAAKLTTKKVKWSGSGAVFTSDDTIKLPSKIARALLGNDN